MSVIVDEAGTVTWKPGEAIGAPDHPHRGFETVSYILEGELEHRDSKGGAGALRSGDVQWMTAGEGIVHSEMPSPDFRARSDAWVSDLGEPSSAPQDDARAIRRSRGTSFRGPRARTARSMCALWPVKRSA